MSALAKQRKAYRLAVVFSQLTTNRRKRSCQACVRSTTGAPRLRARVARAALVAPAFGGDMPDLVLRVKDGACRAVVFSPQWRPDIGPVGRLPVEGDAVPGFV